MLLPLLTLLLPLLVLVLAAVLSLLLSGLAAVRCLCSRVSPSSVMKFAMMKLPGGELAAASCRIRHTSNRLSVGIGPVTKQF